MLQQAYSEEIDLDLIKVPNCKWANNILDVTDESDI